MWSGWWSIAVSILIGVAAVWLVLVVALLLAAPDRVGICDMARLLPDLLRLLKRLAADPEMPKSIRISLVLLLAFVASPIDLIPDVIPPVIGFADDVILIGLVLRWVTRRAGPATLTKHWPGTPDGLTAVCRLCGLSQPE